MELLDTVLSVLKNLTGIIPSVAVLAATIYYISKRSTPEGYMLTIGALIGLLTHLFYSIGIPLLTRNGGADAFSAYQAYIIPVGIISTIGAILFAIGLFMLVHKVVKTPVSTNDPSGY